MSETKHTPGPWRACRNGDCSCGQIFGGDGNTYVGQAYGPKDLDDYGPDCVPNSETQTANYKIMTAAPDMLEALTALLARFDDNPELSELIGRVEIERARAAIAKAEGRS